MKNIILITLVLAFITSCGQNDGMNNENNNVQSSDGINSIVAIEETGIENEGENIPLIEEKSIEEIQEEEAMRQKALLPELEENIKKLEYANVSGEEIERLHFDVKNMLTGAITQSAITNNDLDECNALDDNIIDSCKIQVITKNASDDSMCEKLSDENVIVNCKDTFNQTKAFETLDITLCDKLSKSDDITSPDSINSCKDRIFFDMARSSLDSSKCDGMSDTFEKEQCVFQIDEEMKMQKEFEEQSRLFEKQELENANQAEELLADPVEVVINPEESFTESEEEVISPEEILENNIN